MSWLYQVFSALCLLNIRLQVLYNFVIFFISGLAWGAESWWVELAKRWCRAEGRLGHSWPLGWESAANLEPGFGPECPVPPFLLCTIIKSFDIWKWELVMKWGSTILLALLIVNVLFTEFLISSYLLLLWQWELMILCTKLKFLFHRCKYSAHIPPFGTWQLTFLMCRCPIAFVHSSI